MPKVGMEPIRRDQIRRAAAKVIAKQGFDGTTLRGVAAAARVSTGTVNHYYKNKLAVLEDALLYASEGFQRRSLEAIEQETTGAAKLRALIRTNVLDTSPEAKRGSAVWLWALAESIKSRELFEIIQERRRLFQAMIGGVLGETFPEMSPDDIAELAAEYDVFLNGVCMHYVTGERRLTLEGLERSLTSIAMARVQPDAATAPTPAATPRLVPAAADRRQVR